MTPFPQTLQPILAPTVISFDAAPAWVGKGFRVPTPLPPTLFDLDAGAPERRLYSALDRLAEANRTIEEQRERIAYLESLSTSDELTGLTNRRGFNSHFQRELGHAERDPAQGGVLLMIDLDGFKEINDTLGHDAGDAYLRQVARLLTAHVRHQDVVARLGGDEFAVLLTSVDAETGTARATSLAQQVNGAVFSWMGHTRPVRLSVGLATYGAGDRPEAVMRHADTRMYADKRSRRGAARHQG